MCETYEKLIIYASQFPKLMNLSLRLTGGDVVDINILMESCIKNLKTMFNYSETSAFNIQQASPHWDYYNSSYFANDTRTLINRFTPYCQNIRDAEFYFEYTIIKGNHAVNRCIFLINHVWIDEVKPIKEHKFKYMSHRVLDWYR
ncbi:uncharacterized protein EV154DRAFT_482078 [Mucor mucedo]|uniref:uncharacterized protein n=1 Tax=Mucor mucedo TaxID=29922 RepID=UPI0022202E98|nr:uncharacterized protein EV154DRAFT_482078 [Mucor mucedo]KAI7890486.1 hypothetical protein EV154DRAFT_482078 [Mucor mucedo]